MPNDLHNINVVSYLSALIATHLASLTRTKILLATIVLLSATALLLTNSGLAASPSSGTITPASGPLSYTAGPFVVANESGQGGVVTPVCVAGTALCDQYTLTVNAAGAAATKRLLIQVQWPTSAADFDLYVLQGSTVIGSSHASSDPESVFLNIPADGTVYTIQVIPTTPLGDSITGTIALVDPPATTQTGSGLAPRYQNYSAPEGLGDNAGEPSIGVDWNPNVASLQHDKVNTGGVSFFQSGPNTLRANFDDCSSPAKDQWDDVSTPFVQQAALSDPIGFVDRQSGRVFSLDLIGGQGNSLMAFSDDDGNNYTPGQGGGAPAGPDHETLGGGPYNPNASPAPPSHPLYANAIYYASQNIAGEAEVSRSDDGGLTFGPSVLLFNPTQCVGGIHGHIKVAPDGTVYIPNSSCSTGGGTNGVAVSTDNGITWTAQTVPGSTGGLDPSVGVGLTNAGKPVGQATNTVYLGWISSDNHPHIAISRNRGQTWIREADIGASVGVKSAVFPVVVAGDDNRAAFGFLGTTTPGDYQDDNNFKGVWHLYIATTYDAGNTWITIDATPDDPVQVGSICINGTTCGALDPFNPSSRNLLDFNDFSVDREGRAMLGYADGCLAPACNSGTVAKTPPYYDSRANKASIARQSGGRRLFAAFDPLEPGAPAAPLVNSVKRTGSGVVHLDWSIPDNGGSPITGYRIYRRTENGTYGAPLATVTDKTTYDDGTATDPAETYFYKVTAVNLIGEGQSCGEYPAVPAADPCVIPGVPVLSDPTGDGVVGVPSAQPPYDIQSVSIAEPYNVGADKLVFTIKMKDLTVVPGGTTWPVQFNAPNGTTYVVQMSTLAGGTATQNDALFEYGPDGGTLSPADPLSGFSADGIITIVVPRSGVGNPNIGEQLSAFLMRVTAVAITPDNCPDSLVPSGEYTIVGNASCQPNTAPLAVLSAMPTSGNAPLPVNFNGANSSDPDPGDTIASYSFDFGDGTPVVTQATATISHPYQNAGTYPARLIVKDSRGKSSTNLAQVMITVTDSSPTPTPTPTPLPCNGTRVEDNNEHISYSNGWHAINNSDASSGHYRLNEGGSNQHNVVLTFDAPPAQPSGSITYFYATSPKGGSAEVFIDSASRGIVDYYGTSGSNRAPAFGAFRSFDYGVTGSGHHTLEIRPIKNGIYIDGFCIGSAAATGSPAAHPGTTSESGATQSPGQALLRSVTLPVGTRAISVAAESSANVPIQLLLLDPSGRAVQTVNSSSGVAVLETPISQSGIYIIKVVNLSLGPVQIWTVATPLVSP